jgi:hypothetical protein
MSLPQCPNCRMSRDFAHGALSQFPPGRELVPGRDAGRVWQRKQIKCRSIVADSKTAADYLVERVEDNEPCDRKSPNRNYQIGLQNFKLVIHPGGAVPDFVHRRYPIATAVTFSRKAAADGGEIKLGSHRELIHPAKPLEPSEQRLASGMCERPSQYRLTDTWRLANEHYFADDGAARNGWWNHSRASPALHQLRNVILEQPSAL